MKKDGRAVNAGAFPQDLVRGKRAAHAYRVIESPELPILGGIFLFFLFGSALEQTDVSNQIIVIFNIVGAILLIGALTLGVRNELRRDPMAIWSPIIWFRIAAMVYHGIGALAPYVANDSTVFEMQRLFYFDDSDILKVNIIDASSIFIVLAVAKFFDRRLDLKKWTGPSVQSLPLPVLAGAFLAIGGAIRYGIVVPHLFGFGDGFLSAPLSMASKAYSAGLMLILIFALRSRRQLIPLAIVLVVVEMGVGVLLFSKSDVLITALFVMLAFYQYRPSLYRLALLGGLAFLLFSLLGPLITYGRIQTIQIGGEQQIATASQRLEIVQSFLDGDRLPGIDTDQQGALARLCYVPAQSMVVSWYDRGVSIPTLGNAFIVLIPRVLWPGKPDVTVAGRDLYTAATGNVGTSISPGLFAESYANLGWFGIPLLMIPLGLILTILSKISMSIMRQERYLYLPIVLIGLQIGTRVDGHFVLDVIGAPITLLLLFAMLRIVEPGLVPRAARRA